MARLKNLMQMTGSMAMVSMYTLQGSDQVIIRTKGGPKKQHIKTKPQFEAMRRNNSEWASCTRMTSQLRNSFQLMHRLEDYPVTGALNAICKEVQKRDTEHEHGQRPVCLSLHKELLQGFSFSNKQVLEGVLRVPIESDLNRTTGAASIQLPPLNTDLQLYNFKNLPYYRILACLSAVCDMGLVDYHQSYDHDHYARCHPATGLFESEWLATTGMQAPMEISLQYTVTDTPLPADVSLLLCVGVEFAKLGYGNTIQAQKYAGTGKIIKVG